MICPFCGHEDTKVVDSRDAKEGKVTRRRRECEKCQARFSTYEEVEIMRLTVVKKDGVNQDFDRGKIEEGIRRSLEKRPIDEDRITQILNDIEYEIQSKDQPEISSKEIGKIVLEKLKEVDDVAYLRFASVYKSFGSAETFKKEAEKIAE